MAKILIAEDEQPMAQALQTKLTKEGFEAEIAVNGEDAIEKIKTGAYDLVLLDLIMPVKDGFTVLKEVGTQADIIVTTNLSQEEDEKKVKELGAIDYLVKSNTPLNTIVERVRGHLGQDAPAEQAE